MSKHDKVLKRIYGLFAEGKTPKSLTKEEHKLLQTEYADIDWLTFSPPSRPRIEQSKNETEMQTFARFEKAINTAMKAAKAYVAKGTLTDITLTFSEWRVELDGERVISDNDLIKQERKTWQMLVAAEAQKAKEQSAVKKAAAKIEEQNAIIKELVSLLKVKKTSKKASKNTK